MRELGEKAEAAFGSFMVRCFGGKLSHFGGEQIWHMPSHI